jgi:hypothetical protein
MDTSPRSHALRRSLAALFSVLLVAMLGPGPAAANDLATGPVFKDVSASSPHADAIQRVAKARITLGCAPDRFCPSDGLTRGQMASLVARTLGAEPVQKARFRDVSPSSPHAGSINALAARGIVNGCTAQDFCAARGLTRAQMASVVARAFDLKPTGEHPGFRDAKGGVHERSILALADAGVTLGCGSGNFCGGAPVTRAQFASMLVRAADDLITTATNSTKKDHPNKDGKGGNSGKGPGSTTQPDPQPAPTQPDPQPAPTQPDPQPAPTQPDPEPAPTEPERTSYRTPRCDELNGPVIRLEGVQDARFRERSLRAGTTIDAREATWYSGAVGNRAVNIGGGPGICWDGGTIIGEFPDSDSWDDMHSTTGLNVDDPDTTVLNVRLHNYGDALDMDDHAANFTIRNVWLSKIRDDCVENDQYNSGVLEDSLLDGCYTALSARRNSSDTTSTGDGNLWTIRRNLIRLEPMPTVYKGSAPGHARFWKWDKDGHGVDMALHDNIWRADQPPTHGDLTLPVEYLRSCSNNVMVWLGSGPFPGHLPSSCFTITTDRSVWDDAVASWHADRGR